MFLPSIVCFIIALLMFFGAVVASPSNRPFVRGSSGVVAVVGAALLLASMFTVVPASNVGIVTIFGDVQERTLPEGGHLVAPWSKVTDVYLGEQQAATERSEAGSKDLQSVHVKLTANYRVDPGRARDLYRINPALSYNNLLVVPALYEVFKSVVAHYTAEELITRRDEVSRQITTSLNERLSGYHLQVQAVNLIDFGFSKSFDASIEEKVTASQKAQTAERNLVATRTNAEARIAQARGEAEAIAIQSAAVEKQGGAAYIQLEAIKKWDGKLPTYSGGGAVPFLPIGKQP